jgi:protein-S-isoprenylcysteine O-methyltransferase Ste14
VKSLELKVPPPAVALLAALVMWLAASTSDALAFTLPGRRAIMIALATLGVVISVAGLVSFWRARTTIHPTHPDATSSLVTSGVYRFTRNPMYLGLLLVLAAWAVHFANALALVGLPMFVLYIDRFQIAPEERVLTTKFGAAFDAYRRRTRRWL